MRNRRFSERKKEVSTRDKIIEAVLLIGGTIILVSTLVRMVYRSEPVTPQVEPQQVYEEPVKPLSTMPIVGEEQLK